MMEDRNSLNSLQVSEDSGLDLKEQDGNASGQTKSINSPAKSIENNSDQSTKETFEQLTLIPFPTTISYAPDSLVRHFLSLARGKGSMIPEEPCFLKYAESCRLKDHTQYVLRTSKDCLTTMMGKPFESSSNRWMNWGMMWFGRCLIANFSVSRRIGRECSLSDILEQEVDPKYYLSEKNINNLKIYTERQRRMGRGFQAKFQNPNEIASALRVGGKGKDDLIQEKNQ